MKFVRKHRKKKLQEFLTLVDRVATKFDAQGDLIRALRRMTKRVIQRPEDLDIHKVLQQVVAQLLDAVVVFQVRVNYFNQVHHLYVYSLKKLPLQQQEIRFVDDSLGKIHALLQEMEESLHKNNLSLFRSRIDSLEGLLSEILSKANESNALLGDHIEGKVVCQGSIFKRAIAALVLAALLGSGCAGSQFMGNDLKLRVPVTTSIPSWVRNKEGTAFKKGNTWYAISKVKNVRNFTLAKCLARRRAQDVLQNTLTRDDPIFIAKVREANLQEVFVAEETGEVYGLITLQL